MCVLHEIEPFLLTKPIAVFAEEKSQNYFSLLFSLFTAFSFSFSYLFLSSHSLFILHPFSLSPPPFPTVLYTSFPPPSLLLPFPPYCIRPSPLLPLSDPLPQGIIPPLVVQCVGYINRDSVLREPGLFRIPGDVATIRRIRSDFVRGVSCVCESAIEEVTFSNTFGPECVRMTEMAILCI